MKIGNMLTSMKRSAVKNSPAILIGVGIAGFISSMFLVGKATPKAMEEIDKKKKELDKSELTTIETVQATWKCYVPAFMTAVGSTICIIASDNIRGRRYTKLVAAYGLTKAALDDRVEKTVEVLGEKKDKEIRDAIAKDKLSKESVNSGEILYTSHGETLCFDAALGVRFRADINYVKKVHATIKNRLGIGGEMDISVPEYWVEMDLPISKMAKVFQELGWKAEEGFDPCYTSILDPDTDEPCFVIDYLKAPTYDYRDHH